MIPLDQPDIAAIQATSQRIWDEAPDEFELSRPVDLESCPRCDGTGGVPVGPGLVPWECEYDSCEVCGGTGKRP